MKRPSLSEADVSSGQMLFTLRSALDLTQAELGRQLGVSRRAIGEWEAGNSSPTAEHLKHFIELAVRQQVFPAGQEAQEIRRLWKEVHQKVQLDEAWLQTLLTATSHQEAFPVPYLDGEVSAAPPAPQVTTQPAAGPQMDWGDALAIPTFYGREQELEVLSSWIVQERCQVVSVLGMGGIGKSALVVRTMYGIAGQFEVVLFRSLRDAPSCEAFLEDCLGVLAPQAGPLPGSLEQRITLLLDHLSQRRTLLVLDNLESLLDEKELTGRFRPGFESYERLLHRMAQTAHQSCLLLTSREKAAVLRPLESCHSPVRSLRLSGLDLSAGKRLLAAKEVRGSDQDIARLIEWYAGNPLALRIVSEIITDLFESTIAHFLAVGTVVFGSITDLLDEHWARLSRLEQSLLCWLVILREPATLEELQAVQVTSPLRGVFLGALDSLLRRSLIERGQRPGSFTLQSVVLEYVTAVLIATVAEEIQQGPLDVLIQHGLELAQSKEDLRQVQERLLLRPILAHVQQSMELGSAAVEEQLMRMLEQVRTWEQDAQGYGPANLVALLRLRRGHLRGLDLSQLVLRSTSLQGVQMQDANLCGATLHGTLLTEAMPAIWSVATSPSNQYWAAGSWRGEVRVWCEGGQRLHQVWQAHTDNLFTLTFSPDERTLATGSWDGSVKLWDLHRGALLWTAWHSGPIHSLVFSPDGRTLASGGVDACVRFWEVSSGKQRQTLVSPGDAVNVLAMAWSPDGQRLAAGCSDGSVRLWQMGLDGPGAASEVRALLGHRHWVHGLAFAPNGTRLASGSWDGSVKLWDVESLCELQTLTGHTKPVYDVAWSPDGATVASAGADQRIWLWDVANNRYRAVLQGHHATVYRLAFTPESLHLLSGSEDRTLRVWEVSSGKCVRILQGYANCICDLDWSPQSTQLVSGSTDGLVLLWERTGKTPPRVLGAHEWVVYGVAWSPDGLLLASSGWDNAVRIWEPTGGTCLHLLRDPHAGGTLFFRVAWSPDGQRLAVGSHQQGIQVWEVKARCLQVVEGTKLMTPRYLAWSPDGKRLASGSDDGKVWIWESATGTLQRLPGHHSGVYSVAWSSDGRRLASTSGSRNGGELVVWEVQSGECLRTFVGEPDHLVSAVIWNQSGTLLISGGSNGRLRWWEVESGACLRVQEAHQGMIWSLKRSPDGRWLASSGDDGAIRIWDLPSGELVQTLRRDRPYERLTLTGIKGLNEAQKATLRALGAIEEVCL